MADKQHPYESINTAFAVTDVLIEEGLATRLLNTHEVLIMSAVSQLLTTQDHFHPGEIADLTKVHPGNARHMIRKFEVDYKLLEGYLALSESRTPGQSNRGRHQRLYSPTEFGHRVFGLFQTEKSST